VRDGLCERDDLVADPAHRILIEHATLRIGGDQPVDRKQRRKQSRDPQHASAGAREERPIGPDREGKQRRDHQEEHDRQPRPAAAEGARQIAGDEAKERLHARTSVCASGIRSG